MLKKELIDELRLIAERYVVVNEHARIILEEAAYTIEMDPDVVKCEECKHWTGEAGRVCKKLTMLNKGKVLTVTEAVDYCSNGERRG